MTALLEVRAVSKNFRGLRAVQDASLSVAPGAIFAVIGPNGAGKTSLLEAIVGILPVAAGRVRYQGRLISRLRDRARVLAFMPDAAEPPAEVRVGAFIDGVRSRGGDEDLLVALALTRLRPALIGELSRGERRRLLLFAALASGRPVIILDEPLGVFDPLQLVDVVDVVRQRARRGGSFLMSIHQMADAEKIATEIVLLDAGRVIAAGSLAKLREQVAGPTASLEDVFLRLLQTQISHASP